MKKISKRAHIPHVSGGNGYQWDNGAQAFGHPDKRSKVLDPEKLIKIIDQTAKGFTDQERTDLKRYFIRHFCSWLPLRYIGTLTGVKSHDCVIESIDRVENQSKYLDIKLALMDLRV